LIMGEGARCQSPCHLLPPPNPYRGLGGEFVGRAGEPLLPGPSLKLTHFLLRVIIHPTQDDGKRGLVIASETGGEA